MSQRRPAAARRRADPRTGSTSARRRRSPGCRCSSACVCVWPPLFASGAETGVGHLVIVRLVELARRVVGHVVVLAPRSRPSSPPHSAPPLRAISVDDHAALTVGVVQPAASPSVAEFSVIVMCVSSVRVGDVDATSAAVHDAATDRGLLLTVEFYSSAPPPPVAAVDRAAERRRAAVLRGWRGRPTRMNSKLPVFETAPPVADAKLSGQRRLDEPERRRRTGCGTLPPGP